MTVALLRPTRARVSATYDSGNRIQVPGTGLSFEQTPDRYWVPDGWDPEAELALDALRDQPAFIAAWLAAAADINNGDIDPRDGFGWVLAVTGGATVPPPEPGPGPTLGMLVAQDRYIAELVCAATDTPGLAAGFLPFFLAVGNHDHLRRVVHHPGITAEQTLAIAVAVRDWDIALAVQDCPPQVIEQIARDPSVRPGTRAAALLDDRIGFDATVEIFTFTRDVELINAVYEELADGDYHSVVTRELVATGRFSVDQVYRLCWDTSGWSVDVGLDDPRYRRVFLDALATQSQLGNFLLLLHLGVEAGLSLLTVEELRLLEAEVRAHPGWIEDGPDYA